jgi:hypothetical protein
MMVTVYFLEKDDKDMLFGVDHLFRHAAVDDEILSCNKVRFERVCQQAREHKRGGQVDRKHTDYIDPVSCDHRPY